MDKHFALVSPPDRHHAKRCSDDIRRLPAHRPADDPARVKIHDDRQVQQALVRPDVGDVGHPDRVRFFNIEPPVERVVDHDRRPPAVSALPVALADLRPYARKPGKACNTVRAAGLTLSQKIVMQLAVAVDPPFNCQAARMSAS